MNYSYLTNMNYNAGIYIRLSQEDKDKKYESDSESVTNQKEILRDYCLKNGFNLKDVNKREGVFILSGGAPGTVTVIATKEGTSQYNPARSQPLVITIE